MKQIINSEGLPSLGFILKEMDPLAGVKWSENVLQIKIFSDTSEAVEEKLSKIFFFFHFLKFKFLPVILPLTTAANRCNFNSSQQARALF